MDTAISEYKARREKRLAERGIYPDAISKIISFEMRKKERLDARGYRADAPDDDDGQNNQGGGGSSGGGGGHGNTRLPFGLCMRYGIAIESGWGPSDAWAALAGKGISPSGAFARLKRGEDPGSPPEGGDEGTSVTKEGGATEGGTEEEAKEKTTPPEPPKEPVRKITSEYGGAEYGPLSAKKLSYVSRGDAPWTLYGDKIDGTGDGSYAPGRIRELFYTKEDMYRWLKKKGVEEIADPETGEIVNPTEMELKKVVFERGTRGFTDITIGLRDGKYTIIGTGTDGKKKTIRDFGTLGEAKEYLEAYKMNPDDIKLSPALKKREKERVEWLSSDKKMYFEEEGKRYGDISFEEIYDGYALSGESEDGKDIYKRFKTKAELIKYLKDQGVESVRFGKEKINPQEVEIPEPKVTIGRRGFTDVGLSVDGRGDVVFYGIDMDGKKKAIATRGYSETLGEFKERLGSQYGIGEDVLTVSDTDKGKLADIEKEEAEREKRRKEFETKAIPYGGSRYMDIELKKDESSGRYALYGYTKDGIRRKISGSGDMYDMEQAAEYAKRDIKEFIKDDDVMKDYEKHQKEVEEFESKATDFAGDKYRDVGIEYDGWSFKVMGTDHRGRRRVVASEDSYEKLDKVLNQYGHTPDEFPMDNETKKRKERAEKVKAALDTGDYYKLGKQDAAYKDVRVEEDDFLDNTWKIIGTDVDGKEKVVEMVGSWDEAVGKMSDYGVSDYKMKDKSGAEMGKPKWGMHKVMLTRKPGGGFIVYADSKRYGEHAVMYETPKESEARNWLRENNVPDSGIKTRGMNPNDDVVRTHNMLSLDNFDNHRMEKAEEYDVLTTMDEPTKKETAEMLTEMFDKGAYRMNREDHFTEIVDEKFKNLLETGTSGGSSYKPGRRETGVESFGHDYDIEASEAEKYGYWGLDDDKEAYDQSTAGGYGKIQFKFRKDKVADRATYTFGDSLDAGRPLAGYAGSKPTIEGVTGLDEYGHGSRHLDDIREEYRRYKKGEISFNDFHDYVSSKCQDGYVECQYHGPLTIEDVESIVFPRRALERTFEVMSEAERKRVLTKLKSCGIILQYDDWRDSKLHDGYELLREKYGEV